MIRTNYTHIINYIYIILLVKLKLLIEINSFFKCISSVSLLNYHTTTFPTATPAIFIFFMRKATTKNWSSEPDIRKKVKGDN